MSYNRFLVKGYLGCIEMNLNNNTFTILKDQETDHSNTSVNHSDPNKEKFENPSLITNAIIKIDKSKHNLYKLDVILNYLQSFLCKYIVLDYENIPDLTDLKKIVNTINNYNTHQVQVLLNYTDDLYSDEFADIVLSTNRFKNIIIFNSPFNKNLEDYIHYINHSRNHHNYDKDIVEFIPNRHLYNESLHYHTYFNRKLYIGDNGEIKNAPECIENFGSIQDYDSSEKLLKIIKSDLFQKYWYVKKDMCAVCKDCEFRYMCVDNRLPYQKEDGTWYHTIECNYNPYICKWRNDEGYEPIESNKIRCIDKDISIDN